MFQSQIKRSGFTISVEITLLLFVPGNFQFDPDLGSPHKSCGGYGRGQGGKQGQKWENCVPLGNLLILQDPRYSFPNDDIEGGCMDFSFYSPVTNLKLGLLDIDQETANVTVSPEIPFGELLSQLSA